MTKNEIYKQIRDIIWAEVDQSDAATGVMVFIEPFLIEDPTGNVYTRKMEGEV